MKGMLVFYPEKCSGCNVCSTVCSAYHLGVVNPDRSRIRVLRKEQENLDVVNVCVQCEEKFCIQACPFGALSVNPETGAIVVDHEKCTRCGLCIKACPYNGIILDPILNQITICDLCDGDPQCAKYCPTEAIQFVHLLASKVGHEQNRTIITLTKEIIEDP